MIVEGKGYRSEAPYFWIAYGPLLQHGALGGGPIETGQEVLEVFEHEATFTARLSEISEDLPGALRAARARPTTPLERLAEHRWRRETGGVTAPGLGAIRTDRDTRTALHEAITSLSAGILQTPVQWKTADGSWQSLEAKDLEQIFALSSVHVSICFAVEQQVTQQLETDPSLDVIAAFDAAYDAAMLAQMGG